MTAMPFVALFCLQTPRDYSQLSGPHQVSVSSHAQDPPQHFIFYVSLRFQMHIILVDPSVISCRSTSVSLSEVLLPFLVKVLKTISGYH